MSVFTLPADIHIIPLELNLRKQKWLLIYRPPKQSLSYFNHVLTNLLDFYAHSYNVIIMGDFNELDSSTEISQLMTSHDQSALINKPTCFKSASGRYIDLF